MNKILVKSDDIILNYDLHSLPTAQHKSGLAGLLLMIESMKMRGFSNIPEVLEISAFKASIRFNRAAFRDMFNDLYSSEVIESKPSKKKREKGEDDKKTVIEPKRTERRETTNKKGEVKTEVYYIYDDYIPKGGFLKCFYPDGDGLWLKLWRDMLWNTLRGIPTTRLIYTKEADKKETAQTWNKLAESLRERENNKIISESISSSIFIGAQDENAEKVPFKGNIENNFLLHFSLIASLIFVPRSVSLKKTDRGKSFDNGYALAVPEPSDLKEFVQDAKLMLKELETDVSGYRPRASIICMPEEGGLEYLTLLNALARKKVSNSQISDSIDAVEIYHLQKKGNSIKLLNLGRILPDRRLLSDYELMYNTCLNPFFKSQRIKNLLAGLPWYEDMHVMFSVLPWETFAFSPGETPNLISFFGADVEKKLNAIKEELKSKGGDNMTDEVRDDQLAIIVRNVVKSYVRVKTEKKTGFSWATQKEQSRFKETALKVCSQAFLDMRGRRDRVFVEYFTGVLCSVPQYMPEEDYITVVNTLLSDPDKVKCLAMLAMSATSSLYRSGNDNQSDKKKEEANDDEQ